MLADDLMASAFPDAAACLENVPGDRRLPDHPLVNQTVRDCLQEAMDFDGLRALLERIHRGELRLLARDTPEPSVFASDILNAKPYAFLDDAPLEERRAHAVQTRRGRDPQGVDDASLLDAAAIDRVREEVRPDPRDADELHDALMTCGVFSNIEVSALDATWLEELVRRGRAAWVGVPAVEGAGDAGPLVVVATERVPELRAIHPSLAIDPRIAVPAARASRAWTAPEAITEIIRGRLTIAGPTTAADLARTLGIGEGDAEAALLALESEGVVLRGSFTPRGRGALDPPLAVAAGLQTCRENAPSSVAAGLQACRENARSTVAAGLQACRPKHDIEWCDRSLLARIHRYTLNRLRAEIEPVPPADFMRFLFKWQHVDEAARLTGPDGLRQLAEMLDGFEAPAASWERALFPMRMDRYDPSMLDVLCLSGEVGWARLSPPGMLKTASVTPISLFLSDHAEEWLAAGDDSDGSAEAGLADDPRVVLDQLRARGATFFKDLAAGVAFDADRVRHALGVLVAAGLAASDGFAGLRMLMAAAHGRVVPAADRRINLAGRWTALPVGACKPPGLPDLEPTRPHRDAVVERQAWSLLRRYGVVFRRLLTREPLAGAWRDLIRIYRRLEARGEIRGGRFVSGMPGEHFALPDAIPVLREVRRTPATGVFCSISTADPLNLAGILTTGARVRAAARNRIVYRDGVPVAVFENQALRTLLPLDATELSAVARSLKRKARVAV